MSKPTTMPTLDAATITDIVNGQHAQPFSVLGQHASTTGSVIRTYQPYAKSVLVNDTSGTEYSMNKVHPFGLFEVELAKALDHYQLEMTGAANSWTLDDPYCLPSAIGELDLHLISEGTHQLLYSILGSHVTTINDLDGVHFAVWAPNASRVSVVGEFNHWDGRMHCMRAHHSSGIWDIFVPGLVSNTFYKFEIIDSNGHLLPLKHDPYAPYFEQAPGNASIVFQSKFEWSDAAYLEARNARDVQSLPMSVYEVHAASWRLNLHGESLSYRELADTLIPYVVENNFTHIELLPISEHPFNGSWGYQPIGLFAPTSRFGNPDDFRHFIDRCHAQNIGVIIDWVPAHFPTDEHGLGLYDGTHLYEHEDPRQGMHQDWKTLIFNYGRREVVNYLYSNAVYWIRELHIDGLRVDAVASMLYLDYSREPGEWIPNKHGGRENLEAIEFLKRMNELVHAEGGITLAEESTSFPAVSHPTYAGGLGFTFKWNMGWMNDTLAYMSKDPAHRKYHHNDLTFGLIYAFSENFLLPFSHDEVVHGKGSMINKMPGDDWQKFANLRSCYAFMFAYPGKKLTFMGNEIAQFHEWQHDASIHWHLLEQRSHAQVQLLVRDLNAIYRDYDCLHGTDSNDQGFEWIDCDDSEQSVIAFYRYASDRRRCMIAVCNFTPVVRHDYRIGVNSAGAYTTVLNTDSAHYGGSDQASSGQADGLLHSENHAVHQRAQSISISLPPLSVVLLEPNQG